MNLPAVSARAFTAMQNLNIFELANCTEREIRPLLPSLVRMSLLSPFDATTNSAVDQRKQILSVLVGIEVVNNIVSLLQVDYHELEIDVKKEQQLRFAFVNLHFAQTDRPILLIADKKSATPIRIRVNFTVYPMALRSASNVPASSKKCALFCPNCFTFNHRYSNKIN